MSRPRNIVTMTGPEDVIFDGSPATKDGVVRIYAEKARVLTRDMDLMDPKAAVGPTDIQVLLERTEAIDLALAILDSFGLVPVDLDPTPEEERF